MGGLYSVTALRKNNDEGVKVYTKHQDLTQASEHHKQNDDELFGVKTSVGFIFVLGVFIVVVLVPVVFLVLDLLVVLFLRFILFPFLCLLLILPLFLVLVFFLVLFLFRFLFLFPLLLLLLCLFLVLFLELGRRDPARVSCLVLVLGGLSRGIPARHSCAHAIRLWRAQVLQNPRWWMVERRR